MFKIVDAVGSPIKLPALQSLLEPGDIVSIINSTSGISFIRSNSRSPFGVISANDGYLLSAFCSLIIFQTDKFEHNQIYNKGDLLYSSDGGIFTTRKENDNTLLLGTVNDGRLEDEDYIEIRLI
jgi:hypothetical protein